MSGPITSMIIPDIMIDPIISTMPYAVGLTHTMTGFVIRFMVGSIIRPVAATFTAT
ncbi:hypothetical protein [Pseudomonas putida]|uniref:Uncharacterized protein n=1 Tax=Pseudomonas putida (strain W619) TaxID=390235 RepID=B1J785_PSEPW|nr:hypothetical protein JET17_10580 [Pseudomonas putida]